jgi:hypothetical protein
MIDDSVHPNSRLFSAQISYYYSVSWSVSEAKFVHFALNQTTIRNNYPILNSNNPRKSLNSPLPPSKNDKNQYSSPQIAIFFLITHPNRPSSESEHQTSPSQYPPSPIPVQEISRELHVSEIPNLPVS